MTHPLVDVSVFIDLSETETLPGCAGARWRLAVARAPRCRLVDGGFAKTSAMAYSRPQLIPLPMENVVCVYWVKMTVKNICPFRSEREGLGRVTHSITHSHTARRRGER